MDLFKPEAKNPPNGPIKLAIKPIRETWNVSLETENGRKPRSVFIRSSSLQVGRLNGVRSGYLIGHVIPGIY